MNIIEIWREDIDWTRLAGHGRVAVFFRTVMKCRVP
jgi:hypothetical protein